MFFEEVINRESGNRTIRHILDKGYSFDALFAASDFSALGALLEMKKRGYRVPDDAGIVGYVNEPFAEFLEPGLSSIEQFGQKMGQQSAEVLLREIRNQKNHKKTEVIIAPRLIIRSSSKLQKK
jgi:LacI family transcriptional regulator